MNLVARRKLTVDPSVQSPAAKKETQERYFVSLVEQNAHYVQIVASIIEGSALTDIARHFATNGWITVNERTFTEALRTFRRVRAEHISSIELQGLDSLVRPNQPKLDEIAALEQLARTQNLRLGIAVKFEKEAGMLLTSTARDVEVTRRTLETIAKARGKIKDGGGGADGPSSREVVEDLSRLKKDEGTRNRLHSLTSQLVKNDKDGGDI